MAEEKKRLAKSESSNLLLVEGTLAFLGRYGANRVSKRAQVKVSIHKDYLQFTKKSKKAKKPDSIPLALIWIHRNIEDNEDEDLVSAHDSETAKLAFDIVGPDHNLRFFCKTEAEKKDWVSQLQTAQKAVLKDKPELRRGRFEFANGGVFDGEWVDGKICGRGVFVSPDGEIYKGDWNGKIGAGYGVIIRAGTNEPAHEAGWEFTLSSGNAAVKEARTDLFTPDEGGLTEKDIKTILQGSTIKTFKKGEVVKEEGDVNENLYRIRSGVISLQKSVNGQKKVLAEMTTDQMFGEMSILDKNIISATVVAESPIVELECIELQLLYELFKTHPGLSKRFHKMMARTLAQRLSKILPKKADAKLRTQFSGLLMTSSAVKTEGASPEIQGANKFIMLWNSNDFQKIFAVAEDDIIYRDPFVAGGLVGKPDVQKHFTKLKQKLKKWDWEDVEVFQIAGGFTMRAKVKLTLNSGTIATDHSLALGMIDEKGRLRRLEIYFDTAFIRTQDKDGNDTLSTSSDRVISSPAMDTPVKRRAKDLKFSSRFDLPEDETVTREFQAGLGGATVTGRLYISKNYLCFYSRVFGLKTKEVLPLKSVKGIKKKGSTVVIKYKKPGKGVKLTTSDQRMVFSFSTTYDFEEGWSSIYSAWHTQKGDEIAFKEVDPGGEGKVQNESFIQKFVRCTSLHLALPDTKIRSLATEKSVRITGPNTSQTAVSFEDDVTVRIASTYPKIATIKPDGTVQVEKELRQGDPICDQVCVERFENGVILALADGCNWGEKPRKAAFLASRTFVDFVKRFQSDVPSIQDAANLYLQAFAQAHHRIVEGYEDQWWEAGTTTLIGGALVELNDTYNQWGFVCASVGDCKAYHISRRKVVYDITAGSRTGAAATDARDSGGRIGPHIEGNPDLRNLSVYFRNVDEGDVLILTSDGVYDNLDPQSLGLTPEDIGLGPEQDWQKLPADKVEDAKTVYIVNSLQKLIFGDKTDEDEDDLVELDTRKITDILVNHAIKTTASSRQFMENHPDQKQPNDYKLYPGKMDHTSAICIKVKKSNFKSVEHELDDLVIRMRHPVKGLSSVFALPGASSASALATAAKSVNEKHRGELRRQDTLMGFSGSLLTRWLEANEASDAQRVAYLAQCLLNFRYVRPSELDTWRAESFSPEMKYQFQVYEPIMTRRDWELILMGATRVSFKKDESIITEGAQSKQRLYYIISGTCRIEKKSGNSDPVAPIVAATPSEEPQPTTRKRSKSRGAEPEKESIAPKAEAKIVLGRMSESETFGEISFLFGGPASATIIADDNVELYIIEGSFVNILFVKYPSLGGRFYHYLASVLAHRLKKQEAKKFEENKAN